MKKRLLYFIAVFLFVASTVMAQNRTITGTVTDKSDGGPIPGVSVLVKGSSIGAQTDIEGKYSIAAPANSTLVFKFVGYSTKEVTVGATSTVNISLEQDAKQLGEVVVTALGVTKVKRDLGYATQTVKGDQLADKGDVNIINTLQGKVAGVDITGASGNAGSSSNIILRGISSFTGNNSPLFVVDGVPVSNDLDQSTTTLYGNQPANRALDLNLNNIESMNILQGPAAAALYGSRASNGAIIITTKRGSGVKGKTAVTFSSSYGVQNVYGFADLQNKYGQGAGGAFNSVSGNSWGPAFGSTPSLANGLVVATGTTPNVNGVVYQPGSSIAYNNYKNNLIDYFNQGTSFENNLSINSGDAKNNYGLTLGNTNQTGILPTSEFKKLNAQFTANLSLTDKLTLGTSINYFNTIQNGATTQGNGANSSMFGIWGVTRSTDFNYYKNNYINADGSNNWFIAGRDNPYFAANSNSLTSNLSRVMGNVNLGYDVFSWLNVGYRLGLDTYTDRRKRSVAIGSTQAASSAGSVMNDQFFRSEFNGDLLITAKKSNIFVDGLNASVLLGQNINQRVYQNATVKATGLSIPGYWNVANGSSFTESGEASSKRRLIGYYAQMSLGYKNYLFLELTGRVDQSSTLPTENNTFFYPSVSSSFVFTDAFNIQSDILSMGKVRASYAKVGKDANPYVLSNTYSSWSFGNNVATYNFPSGSILGYGADATIANPLLSPEFTSSYEFGTNLSFLKDRINLDLTYYNQSSKNQIIAVGLPASSGYDSRYTNIGEITNKGIEATLGVTAIGKGGFRWDVSANFAKNNNKVVSIAEGVPSFAVPGSAFGGVIPSVVVGQPYGVIMGSTYNRNENGDLLIDPKTGLYAGTTPNQVVANPNRDWTAGLTNTFKYKNFTLSALVDYKKGGQLVSWTIATLRGNGSLAETGVDREMPHILPGVIANSDGSFVPNNIQIPAQTYWNSGFGGIGGGEFAVFDATTFRMRELTLSYDLKGSMIKTSAINNIRFTVYGRNLFYYAPNSPIDPEVNTQGAGNIRGLELQSAPNTRNFGASIKVSF
ncbi:SusC/RagA family TonB-linked outer membrane protein [Solitalea longa]|uniref:SusC/RagA family TonB-linked outer membrane protein n=1 Tax=Solitalea longa TaxID=2079460 RepID=A0A2S5A3D0_9SPHI|nr:SusC/RagA family TonB-linked outer membrane protein [Solitalea longa]POY37055.1 SusC/RagA family TonB-linked outer membrane protein [Solitalea longa]